MAPQHRSLPLISGRRVAAALLRAGFRRVSQKGSHVKYRHRDGRTVIVPMHRQLKRPTLASLLLQAGMTAEQLGLR